jgi:DNA-binding transcriptional LysR family regulator
MPHADTDLDVKHLIAFDAIFESGSISNAALRLGMSQPSVSLMLSRLREHFGDPLFVRTSRGMQPTAMARTLSEPVKGAIGAFRRASAHTEDFDPARSNIVFRISLTDIGQLIILPALALRLRELAPKITLNVATTTVDSYKSLESDELDLSFGSVRKLQPSCFQKTLFEDRFVCIASATHNRISNGLTTEEYFAEEHVVVSSSGIGMWLVEAAADRSTRSRKIVFELPNFLALARLVEGTDLLATVPIRLAHVLAAIHKIKILSLPISIPTYAVKQCWHKRQHNNPANRWLRGLVATTIASAVPKRLDSIAVSETTLPAMIVAHPP